MRLLHSVFLVGCLAAVASGDFVHLADGTVLEGDVKRTDDGWLLIGATGKMTTLTMDQVKSIQMTPSTKPAAMMDRLLSLRRAMDNVSDASTAIDRYQKFIDQTTDETTVKAAQADLATWKQRQDQGMVKFGNQWIAPGDKSKIQEQSLALAAQARDFIRQGRLKEADPILQQAIATDPGCASAHYLRGLVLYRQDQFSAARKEFEATLALVPDHVPTLNNLAIVIDKQNQIPGALNQYDRAMIVSPQDRWILTNVAEVLQSLPADIRKNEIARRVQKRFDEQIGQLETKLAAQGLYRWGATWVNAAELDKLKAVEAANKSKLDALSVDFDAAQADITRVTQSILDNSNTLHRIESESVRYDANGQLIRLAYPPVYYEIVRDNQRLNADRTADVTKMEQIRTAAKAIQEQMPTPQYTGVQQIIGIEGTPVVTIATASALAPNTTPATPPTTQPAPQ